MKRLGSAASLKEFFKMLNIYFYNFRVLHWKIKDDKFEEIHELMNEYYDRLSDDIDLVAEMLLSNDVDIVGLKNIVESDYKLINTGIDYSYNSIVDEIDLMFGDIVKYTKRLLNEDPIVTNNPGITSELENLYMYYDKELNYKNKRRR